MDIKTASVKELYCDMSEKLESSVTIVPDFMLCSERFIKKV